VGFGGVNMKERGFDIQLAMTRIAELRAQIEDLSRYTDKTVILSRNIDQEELAQLLAMIREHSPNHSAEAENI
jgi:hypothetical protein